MATLIVTGFTPRAGTGRGLRTVGVARAIARFDDVEIAYAEFDGSDPAECLRREPRVTLRKVEAQQGLSRGILYLRARLAGIPPGFARGIVSGLANASRSVEADARIVADGPAAAAALMLVSKTSNVIYNAQNLESAFRSTLSGSQRWFGSPNQLAEFERRLMTAACETWLPSPREVRQATALAPGANVRCVPNVLDVAAITPVTPARTGRILFVGDFGYEPNSNAAALLVQQVMPRVWEARPDASLALVGRSLQLEAGADPRIDVLGFVDDLRQEYERSECAVVPLMQGGGSQLKFVEALAYGLPVVATPLAASGLESAVPDVHFLKAERPEEIASTLVSVLEGRAPDVAANGRLLAEREYSIDALATALRPPVLR